MVSLENCALFRSLNDSELAALRTIAQKQNFSAGREIFREGDAGDGVYFISEGAVEISAAVTQGRRSVLSQLGPGELFGEMSVLEIKPRSATATAANDSVIYFVPRDALLAMVAKSPALAMELLRDISRRLREFNQRHVQEILQAERLGVIGRFARTIVHDLKNPLNVISLTSEISALEKTTAEQRKKFAATIRYQVERIAEMVGDILDFTGGVRTETLLGGTDYAAFVKQVLEEIRAEIELRGSRLEIQMPIPPLNLPLDPKRLRRVFVNLIHNATDAMPNGGTIFARFQETENELVTEIADTGPGIAPEIADKLFQVFATFGKEHGTGLGLSICKKIVEDHRGRIWARNEPRGGAVFSFALPVVKRQT
jgi:signal transduction histidine kinase